VDSGVLNYFKLQPALDSIKQLEGLDGLQFHLPPNSMTEMRLKSDDIKGPPILSYNFMFRNHKIKSYYTKVGLAKRANQLGEIIEKDMNEIDSFVKRWYEIHKPLATSWEGIPIK
jgi:hypothetical protein